MIGFNSVLNEQRCSGGRYSAIPPYWYFLAGMQKSRHNKSPLPMLE